MLSAQLLDGSAIKKFAFTIVYPPPLVKITDSAVDITPHQPKIPVGSPLVIMIYLDLRVINGSIVFVHPSR